MNKDCKGEITLVVACLLVAIGAMMIVYGIKKAEQKPVIVEEVTHIPA